jgi:purine-binding chemotaxis protein CheW
MSNENGVRSDLQGMASEQFLTFVVDGEEYGVDILRVQEIRGWSQPMPIPNTPPFIKGVINIRGDIVPIADLRERLGLAPIPVGSTTAVVVLRVSQGSRHRVMGIVVDAMSDVTNVPVDQIKTPPRFGHGDGAGNGNGGVPGGLARAIATIADKMVTILDVDQVFALSAVPAAAGHTPSGPATSSEN